MNTALEITQEKLKELLHYDKHTGIFTWKLKTSNKIKIGQEAGTVSKVKLYREIQISLNGKLRRYKAHRLAWLYEHGSFPENEIDHINHNRSDNRISNIRKVNHKTNNRNRDISPRNTSGVTGVYLDKKKEKWRSQITVNWKSIKLGTFENKDDAIMARLHANRLYKFHANHGKDLNQKESK